MISALSQGSLIYILDKTDSPTLKIGKILSISQPKTDYTNTFNQFQSSVVDIKVDVQGTTCEYNSIPSNLSVVTYNNGTITISESKLNIQHEVETILENSKQILDKIDKYKQNIVDCEEIIKQLNPQYAKDKERDDKLSSLESRINGVDSKLEKIISLVTKEKEL